MDSDSENNSESTADHQGKENLVRSQYYDVMVKVDADVYCLDKLQLAWKSDYFEKLLIEYTDRKECSLIELPVMDTDTFSAIVDIIYGKTLTSVLNHENHITLLMAMDYFQMDMDLKTYANFIENNSVPDVKIFKLNNFVQENPNLQCLLPSVLEYLSVHMTKLQTDNDFLSLPFEHLVQIVLSRKDRKFANRMREISQTCSEWIYYDLRNRLPHVAKLVNAAKRRFGYVNEIMDEEFNTMLSNIAGKMNLEMMTKLFYKFLVYDGEVNPAPENLLKVNDEKNQDSIASYNKENERKKLTRLLENGHFHDIVVNVGEKTYKLHRFMLNPASGYFAEISSTKQSNADAQCAEASAQQQQPNQNEYTLRDVDQTTFDMIIKYIYFDDELPLTSETITRVLRAANILKMKNLFDRCLRWMQNNIEQICTEVLIIDECFSTSWIRENIKEISSKVLIESEISDTSPICSFSFDLLEDLLFSSSDCCGNPHKIVDICSKWVMHDVINRYHLVPQIALAINHNRNYYEMEASTDLNNCTEELIRDELWKILHSTVLVPSAKKISENYEKKFHETPVFVALTRETSTIHVLNANLEQITSLYLSNDANESYYYFCVAATLIDDNLFIASSSPHDGFVFCVYNLSLKKFVSLSGYVDVKDVTVSWNTRFWLLNCRGQVYCCFKQGHVLKYSTELNRWIIFSKKPVFSDKISKHGENSENGEDSEDSEDSEDGEDVVDEEVWFTSDGDTLYRLYARGVVKENYSSKLIYAVDEFNFQQNMWSSLSDLSFTRKSDQVHDFTILNDGKFTVLLRSKGFMSFDRRRQNSRVWREFSLTDNYLYPDFEKCYVLMRCEGRLIHVIGDKLYHWSQTNQTWELKKELPSRFVSVPSKSDRFKNPGPYACISAIHKHNVGTV
ncbi:uncharacterized protein LOC135837717 [Planococcus citri]|uniref:uncharacterized protein LOC135837717 n=1 Tax=Planococcus citri TaxID=170843 RepID=UPI0031FA12FE